jgi:hypothetical protein
MKGISMKTQIAKASKAIHAPAERVYEIIADYRTKHPLILPKPYFLSLDVEEGGVGEGTIVQFKMRLLGQTRSFRSLITESEPFDVAQGKPGRTLLETDINSGVATRFHVTPAGPDRAEVTIATELKRVGVVEGFIARMMLQKVYREELDLLARLAESQDVSAPSVSTESG